MKNEVATLSIPVGDDLYLQTENGQVTVSSRYIAERFGKEHRNVLRDIENIISTGMLKIEQPYNDGYAQNCAGLFIETKYQHEQNKQWDLPVQMLLDGN